MSKLSKFALSNGWAVLLTSVDIFLKLFKIIEFKAWFELILLLKLTNDKDLNVVELVRI